MGQTVAPAKLQFKMPEKRRFRPKGPLQAAVFVLVNWSERGDLNSRPPVPQTGALTELRYAPTLRFKH